MRTRNCYCLIIISGILLILISDCKKENIDPTIHYDRKIYIRAYFDNDNRITAYEYLDSIKNIINTTHILYFNNLIIEKSNDTLVRKYNLNEDGLIDCVIDSSVSKIDTLFTADYYESDYIKSLSLFETGYSIDFEYSYNEDYASYYIHLAFVSVSLYDSSNMVDFIINPNRYYLNLKNLGRQNLKLVKHVTWAANGGPSTYPDESDYKYKWDNNGFLIEKIETYYPAHYYTSELQEEDIEHYITYFEYINNNAP